MRYIKTYEYMNGPQIGEYVICHEYSGKASVLDFLQKNIGKIVDYDSGKYEVFYENVPPEIKENFYNGKRLMEIREIVNHSWNIDDLESILSGNKFNL